MRPITPDSPEQGQAIANAVERLREARTLLRQAGARQAARRRRQSDQQRRRRGPACRAPDPADEHVTPALSRDALAGSSAMRPMSRVLNAVAITSLSSFCGTSVDGFARNTRALVARL